MFNLLYWIDNNYVIKCYEMKTSEIIKGVARDVVTLLLKKCRLWRYCKPSPTNIFKLSPKAILARLDDKLSRVKHKGLNDITEDTVTDIIGYLILYKVQLRKEEIKTKK